VCGAVPMSKVYPGVRGRAGCHHDTGIDEVMQPRSSQVARPPEAEQLDAERSGKRNCNQRSRAGAGNPQTLGEITSSGRRAALTQGSVSFSDDTMPDRSRHFVARHSAGLPVIRCYRLNSRHLALCRPCAGPKRWLLTCAGIWLLCIGTRAVRCQASVPWSCRCADCATGQTKRPRSQTSMLPGA